MKNLICLILLTTLSFSSIQAQNIDTDQLQNDLKEVEQELSKVFQELGNLFAESPMTKDSTFTKMFTFPLAEMDAQFGQMNPDSMMMGDMLNLMQAQMLEFSKQDFSELENFFKSFGEQLEMIPAPGDGKENSEPGKKKKKRKTTSM